MTPLPIALAVLFLVAQQAPVRPAASVSGKVVSAINGAPIRTARVSLRSSLGNFATDSDDAGNFTIGALAAGDYEISVSRPRFGTASNADVPRFKLTAGQSLNGLTVRLTPLGAIAGRILDADGDPATNVSVEAVQLVYTKGREQLQSVQAVPINDRGEYRLFDLLPGRYYVRTASAGNIAVAGANGVIISRGSQFAEIFLGDTMAPSRATPVDLPPGGEVSGADIRIARNPGYAIRARLIGGRGQVTLERRSEQPDALRPIRSVQTTPEAFEFLNLAPGTWILRAQTVNPVGLPRAGVAQPAAPNQSLVAQRVVEITDHDVTVDLTFGPFIDVAGVVKATGAVPVSLANQRLQFQGASATSLTSAQLQADGSFAASQLAPDVYQLVVLPAGSAYVTSVKVGDREYPGSKLDLTQALGGTLTVTVSAELGQVGGVVIGAENKPVSGATVILVPDQDSPDSNQTTISNAEGGFSFAKIRPGHFRVFAWPDPPRSAPRDDMGVSIDVRPNGVHTVNVKLIERP